MRWSNRRLPVWALGVGILAILAGLVWKTAVFPRLDRIPADLHQVLHLQGTWKVLDPATMQPQEIQLAMTEEYRARGTRGRLLLLERQVTASNAGTGEPLERLRS
ncbi:MAG: DUF3068 domain-containing protein, partial [Chloroflexi bacterium]|nr:DUF3068 domain-containing protein [Chloroflexota bacterium]